MKNKKRGRLLCIVLLSSIAAFSHAKGINICFMDSLSAEDRIVRKCPNTGFRWIDEERLWRIGDGWRRNKRDEPWKRYPYINFGTFYQVAQSDDRQCELYFDPFTGEVGPGLWGDDETYAEYFVGFYPQAGLRHREFPMHTLLVAFDGRPVRFEDYVTVIGGRIPREWFNADSLLLWDFPIAPIEQDGERYTHCTFMSTTRQGRATLVFVWFFTDEGFPMKWHYISQLKKSIWYKDTKKSKRK